MSIIIMLLLISVLIVVHEFGHYITARAFGVCVKKFAIGLPIGPTLYKKQFGETEFLIHAFLFGGYVSLLGEDDDGKEKKEENVPDDSPLLFKNKAKWQKAIVFVAGVACNAIFAFLLVIFTASIYHKLPTGYSNVYIDSIEVEGNSSNVVNSGLQKGDRIIAFNGIEIVNANQFISMVQKSKFYDGMVDENIINQKLEELKKLNNFDDENSTIENGKTIILAPQTPEAPLKISKDVSIGYEEYKPNEIKLDKETINLRDKLKNKNDFKVDNNNYTYKMVATALSDSYKPINITVLRNNQKLEFNNLYTNEKGFLGVRLDVKDIYYKADTPKDVIVSSYKYCVYNLKLMVFGLKQIVTGKISASEMHGIVLIAKVGGDIIENNGILDGLLLTAVISLNLALINLLPIPALDGGHLLILFLEVIFGKKLNEKAIDKISTTCFILLLILMVLIVFNDIFALVTNKF